MHRSSEVTDVNNSVFSQTQFPIPLENVRQSSKFASAVILETAGQFHNLHENIMMPLTRIISIRREMHAVIYAGTNAVLQHY